MELSRLWIGSLRYLWSNWRYRRSIKVSPIETKIWCPVAVEELDEWLEWAYSKFEWTMDGYAALWDAMDTPPSCLYSIVNTNTMLKDDCDGFHAAVLEAVRHVEGCEAHLLTYVTIPIRLSHTVLVIKCGDQYLLIDYDACSAYRNVADIVWFINRKNDVLAMEFSQYSPEKGWHTGWKI